MLKGYKLDKNKTKFKEGFNLLNKNLLANVCLFYMTADTIYPMQYQCQKSILSLGIKKTTF